MQKGITLFLAVYTALMLLTGVAYYMSGDHPEYAQYAGMGLALLMFGLAYVAHRASGAVGNPFNGLVLGNFKWISLSWIGGIVCGVLAVGIAVGLGFVKIDPDMTWFLQFTSAQAAKNSGQPLPESALGVMKITFKIMSALGPIFGVPLAAALMSLGFFPVYGWLGRRLLARGLPYTLGIMCVLGLISTASSALVHNPMYEQHNMALALPIAAAYGLALTAVLVWLFLMSNSVIVPAVAFASFSVAVGSCQYYFADAQAHMVPPTGLSDLIVLVLVALALWMAKVPDGRRMAVVAVAFDGTSLNAEQLAAVEASARSPYGQTAPAPQNAGTEFVAAAPQSGGEPADDSGSADSDAPPQG